MSHRFTPQELREMANAVRVLACATCLGDPWPFDNNVCPSCHGTGEEDEPIKKALCQAAEDAEEVERLHVALCKAAWERDEARAIARRWHATTGEIDGEFYSLRSQALDELLADAAIIAGWP